MFVGFAVPKTVTLLCLNVGGGRQVANLGKKNPSSSFNYCKRMTLKHPSLLPLPPLHFRKS